MIKEKTGAENTNCVQMCYCNGLTNETQCNDKESSNKQNKPTPTSLQWKT